MTNPYAQLPAVTALLADARLSHLPHGVLVEAAREVLSVARAEIAESGTVPGDIVPRVLARASAARQPRLRRVINATGVVLHTNLGRAPLAGEAIQAAARVGGGYANLELELATGARGGRLSGVTDTLCGITGAEAALAVNNNAAGVLLALTALASGRDVIVSRGELVEIGGSFRVPDVISAGGARLIEVGTTNRTRVEDYAAAITENTAVLLRVHPSNFRVVGFTEAPDRRALVALAEAHGVVVVEDLGSGLLGRAGGDLPELAQEQVEAAVADGVHLVCFSGDKLLGGPQAGLIAGRADLVQHLRRHPFYRALRLDKLVLAALEATLRMVAEGRAGEIPARRMLAADAEACRAAAARIAAAIPGARVEPDVGRSGGGALPGRDLDTYVVVVGEGDPEALAAALRTGPTPVVARVARGSVRLDPRTVLPEDEAPLIAAVCAALASPTMRG